MRNAHAFSLACVLALVGSCFAACDSPIFSFEGGSTQNWQGGVPPDYAGSASQAAVYSMTQHPTDGSNNLRVAYDYTSSTNNAKFFVPNLNLDLSQKSSLVFDIWKSGALPKLSLALTTGSGKVWHESVNFDLQDGPNTVTVDLTSSNWKTQASGWVNNAVLANRNLVTQITVVLQPNAVGYNEAFLDNFRLCSSTASSSSSSSSSSTTTPSPTTGSATTATGTTGTSTTGGSTVSGFVSAVGTKFYLNGCPFYVVGSNNYYGMYKSNKMVDSVMDNAQALQLNVVRVWGFLDIGNPSGGYPYSVDGAKDGNYIQYWDTNANAPAYNDGANGIQKLDYIISAAKKRGIRLIFTMTNNWKDFGGADQYVKWYGLNYHDDFFTNAAPRKAYQNYLAHVINRVNPLTGIAYKNEPAIFAWELINEPRCFGSIGASSSCNPTVIKNWINEMSTYIKTIDSNHMISVGDEGFFAGQPSKGWIYDGSQGGDFDAFISVPNIAFGTYHLYPGGWGQSNSWGNTYIQEHITSANNANKPVIMEEFGITSTSDRPSVYQSWLSLIESSGAAGDTYWMIAGVQDDGSLYPDYDGFTIYNENSVGGAQIKSHVANMKAKTASCTPQTSSSTSTTAKATTGTTSTTGTTGSSSTTAKATTSSTSTTAKATTSGATTSTTAKATTGTTGTTGTTTSTTAKSTTSGTTSTTGGGACDAALYSFEGGDAQGWAGGLTDKYPSSSAQQYAYSTNSGGGATDGTYSLRVAYNPTSTSQNAVYFVENLNLDFSTKSTLKFSVWKDGAPASTVTLALTTGSGWTWYESAPVSLTSSGFSYLSFSLKTATWNGSSSIANLNNVRRIAISFQFNAVGFNTAYLDNIRVCN